MPLLIGVAALEAQSLISPILRKDQLGFALSKPGEFGKSGLHTVLWAPQSLVVHEEVIKMNGHVDEGIKRILVISAVVCATRNE